MQDVQPEEKKGSGKWVFLTDNKNKNTVLLESIIVLKYRLFLC